MFINLPSIALLLFTLLCWQQQQQQGVLNVQASPSAYTQTTSLANNIHYRSRNATATLKPTASTIAAIHRHRRNRQRERQRQQQIAAEEAAAATATPTRTTSSLMSNLQTAFVYRAEVPQPLEMSTTKTTKAAGSGHRSTTASLKQTNDEWPQNGDLLSAVTVVLNGDEPQLTDALGHKVPKPEKPLQVASPIDLLNPDRYEFYTFDENGELVKRLMTMQEIQSIVANGDGEGPAIIHKGPLTDENPEQNIENIVNNVQNVLNHEVQANRNTSAENILPVLDTPDVSSTWSIILPAILGNTGDEIMPQQPPQQIVMIPDSDLIESSTSKPVTVGTTRRRTKPNHKRKPGQKRKTTTSASAITSTTARIINTDANAANLEITPQIVQEELDPYESVYTGIEQYHEVTANMEDFDSYANFQKIPLYQKLPDAMTTANFSKLEPEIKVKPIPLTTTIEMITGLKETETTVTPSISFTKPLRKTTTATTSKPATKLKGSSTVSITIMESKRRRKPTKIPQIASTFSTTADVNKVLPAQTTDSPLVTILISNPNESKFTTLGKDSNAQAYNFHATATTPASEAPTTSVDLIAEHSAHLNIAHNKLQQLQFESKLSTPSLGSDKDSVGTTHADNPFTIFSTNAPTSHNMQITTVADSATEAAASASATTATSGFEQVGYTTMSATPNSSVLKDDVYPQPTYNFNNENSDEYNNYKESGLPMPIAQKPSIDDLDEEMDNQTIDQEEDGAVEEEEEVIDINAIKSFDKILQTLTQAARNNTTGANNYIEQTMHRAEDQSSSNDMWEKVISPTGDYPKTNQRNQTNNQTNEAALDFTTTAVSLNRIDPELVIVEDLSTSQEEIVSNKSESMGTSTPKDETEYSEISQTNLPAVTMATEYDLKNTESQPDTQTEDSSVFNQDTSDITESADGDATTLRPAVLKQVEELITQQMQHSVPQQTFIQFDPKPYVNMDILLQQKPVNMSIYQQQAATVASALLHSPTNSSTLRPNPDWDTIENTKKIETLMTDVILTSTDDNNTADADHTPVTLEADTESNNPQEISTDPKSDVMGTDTESTKSSEDDSNNTESYSGSYEKENEFLSETTTINNLVAKLSEEPAYDTADVEREQESSTTESENLLTTNSHLPSSQSSYLDHELEVSDRTSQLVSTEMPERLTESYEFLRNTETEGEVAVELTKEPDRAALFESDNLIDRTTQLAELEDEASVTATDTSISLHEEQDASSSTWYAEKDNTTDYFTPDFNGATIKNKDNETIDFPTTLAANEKAMDTVSVATTQETLKDFSTMAVNESSILVFDSDTTEAPSDETMQEYTENSDVAMSTTEITSTTQLATEINKTAQLEESIVNLLINAQHLADVEESYVKLGETTLPPEHLYPTTPINRMAAEQSSVDIRDEEDEDDQITEFDNIPNTSKAPLLRTINSTATTASSTTSFAFLTNSSTTTTPKSTTRRMMTLKPVSYFNKQPSQSLQQQPLEPMFYKQTPTRNLTQQKPQQSVVMFSSTTRSRPRPAQLNNLMAASTQATRPPIKLEPSPMNSKGLEASIANLDEDVLAFTELCNELAFTYWKAITSEKISSARSLLISPFALTSMLSMLFLGARGRTSGEMNDILRLDDMVTFNPHVVFKNITDSVERAPDTGIATAAFVREFYSDRANGKILQFYKEKIQQFYSGHVEEVNFHVVNDIIRRRTNLLMKRHTRGKVLEYLRTNSVWINGPLATVSANLFQTDCSKASTHERDGELFFQVHPTIRQRRLIPIPAVLYKTGFTAGYEPNLDATVVGFGRIEDTVSLVYVMPGQQSSQTSSDNLERLEKELMDTAVSQSAWKNLLTSLMDRPGMEVQLPRFSHRSFINATLGLQKLGLKGLFTADNADLAGLTGSSKHDIYLADMIQINTFSTCGEERIADHHHVEMYPAPPLRKRNKNVNSREDDELDSSEAIIDFGSLVHETALGRGFYDDLLDPKYLELPLPLRPRQARVPDARRLRFDKPFLYFVRHNPTGMILYIGRFNPRLLP